MEVWIWSVIWFQCQHCNVPCTILNKLYKMSLELFQIELRTWSFQSPKRLDLLYVHWIFRRAFLEEWMSYLNSWLRMFFHLQFDWIVFLLILVLNLNLSKHLVLVQYFQSCLLFQYLWNVQVKVIFHLKRCRLDLVKEFSNRILSLVIFAWC